MLPPVLTIKTHSGVRVHSGPCDHASYLPVCSGAACIFGELFIAQEHFIWNCNAPIPSIGMHTPPAQHKLHPSEHLISWVVGRALSSDVIHQEIAHCVSRIKVFWPPMNSYPKTAARSAQSRRIATRDPHGPEWKLEAAMAIFDGEHGGSTSYST